MDALTYLQSVVDSGRNKAAKTREEMDREVGYHGFDSFNGLYYDLAKMELTMRGKELEPVRDFAIEKALARMDGRLDCADFAIPALIRMLKEHRNTILTILCFSGECRHIPTAVRGEFLEGFSFLELDDEPGEGLPGNVPSA